MHDHDRTTVLLTTRTAFEADSIASALKARGIDARVLDAATAAVWSGMLGGVKIVVLESQLSAARAALFDVRREGDSIDWAGVDVGESTEPALVRPMSRSHRWMWTLAVLLLPPAGLMVLSHGVGIADPLVQILGGTLMVAAMVIAVSLIMPARMGSGPREQDKDEDADDAES